MDRAHSTEGFTLVELLVVVTIIVALLAILLPSVGRAVEAAHRAACASNLRQQQMAFVGYAADYDRLMPFGHVWSTMQFNYVIGGETVKLNSPFGRIWATGRLPMRENWICPTFGSGANDPAWPPDDFTDGEITRSHFGLRPSPTIGASTTDWRWDELEQRYLTLTRLRGTQALLSDWAHRSDTVLNRHEDGLNVAYMGGHAAWIALSEIEDELNLLTTMSNTMNQMFEELWAAFDRAE